jgi:hypothetical protein
LPSDDIRDIRGPIHLPERWPFVLGGAATLVLLGVLYAWLRRRDRSEERELPPCELALSRLEIARFLLQDEKPFPFFFTLADTLREYLQARFAIPASSLTTEEVLRALKKPGSALGLDETLVKDTLNVCDLAKFAHRTVPRSQMEDHLLRVRSFVLKTRVVPESGIKAGGASALEGKPS